MSTKTKNAVIIVAAGRGSRMGKSLNGPKQYEKLADRAILDLTCEAFLSHPGIHIVLVVIHKDDIERYNASVQSHPKLLGPVIGGSSRQESGLKGLRALEDLGHEINKVLIHDAARPFVCETTISAVLEGVDHNQGALPGIAVVDTLKLTRIDQQGNYPEISKTVSRENLFTAQTPQGFFFNEILQAHENAWQKNKHKFTDDSAVFEWAGHKMTLAAGNVDNFKITTIADLDRARNISMTSMKAEIPEYRTGSGYDVHRIKPGGPITLCGLTIDNEFGLDGHSDADVALHALTDALLGAICNGDIGSHFPPSDPKWKGAQSDQFLKHACSLVDQSGGRITHVDITIIGERPRIGPYRDAMRAQIGKICDLPMERVSVKATTHERIGTLGRGEGLAALASATVAI